ncbi:centrosomal protein of 89 kDa isoform X1 [Cloeon dipterum]|uniref:centrosomal protein of 89 kDa isoform X1 n=1 Tax=Cloeon dipterum TaxID=197152 RepID=UPI00321FF2CA
MNIDLLGRIRRVFSFSAPRRVGTEMEPKRPERSNRPPRSKSAGTLSQSQEELQEEDIAEVHRRPKKNEIACTESLLLDRELLENLVWRLNVELGRYETRLRELEGQDNVPDGDRAAPAWCRADPTTLGPLLAAYDEALAEKDSVIEKYESRLKELGAELREVISENERLHEAFEEVQNESVLEREERELASKDVESLHSENVALLGRLEDYKARVEELEEILLEQRNDFVKRSEEMVQQQAQMKALARDYRVLQDQLDEASREIENRVPQQHHQSSINECKTLLEELRSSYDKDRRILEDRLAAMTKEKVEAEAKARAAMSEAAHMEAKAKATEKLLRRAESRSERLQTKLVAAESCRDSSVRELKQLMAVAEKLTTDQENLVRLIAAKRYCCEESVIGAHKSKLNQSCSKANQNKK